MRGAALIQNSGLRWVAGAEALRKPRPGDLQPSAFNIQSSAFSIQHSAFSCFTLLRAPGPGLRGLSPSHHPADIYSFVLDQSPTHVSARAFSLAGVSNSALLIAVVDDEEPVRRALGRLLRSADLAVELFPTGQEFLASLDDHRPDCLVLDLHMPSMDGFEVQSRLIGIHAAVPTVVITGHDSPEARERVLRSGATAFLRKPVNERLLLDAITRAVEAGKRPGDECGDSDVS